MKNRILRFLKIKHRRYYMIFFVGKIPNGITYRISLMDIYGIKPFLNHIETVSNLKEKNKDCDWIVLTNFKELSKKDYEDFVEIRQNE